MLGTNFRESDLLRSVPDLELPKSTNVSILPLEKKVSISNLAKDIL